MVGIYVRVATKEQAEEKPDIKTVSEKALNEIKSNRYLLSPRYELLLRRTKRKHI